MSFPSACSSLSNDPFHSSSPSVFGMRSFVLFVLYRNHNLRDPLVTISFVNWESSIVSDKSIRGPSSLVILNSSTTRGRILVPEGL